MKNRWNLLLVLAALSLLAAACTSTKETPTGTQAPEPAATQPATPATTPSVVKVVEREWAIQPAVSTVAAGKVRFEVTNIGRLEHEVVVLRTDTAPARLPIDGGKAREVGDNMGEVEDVAPGATKALTLDLSPGRYLLICNIPSHYQTGMHVAISVT